MKKMFTPPLFVIKRRFWLLPQKEKLPPLINLCRRGQRNIGNGEYIIVKDNNLSKCLILRRHDLSSENMSKM